MTNSASTSGLFELGRRLERLLYFGSILLLICFFELYFVSATVYSRVDRPDGVAQLIRKFEANDEQLKALFRALGVPTGRNGEPDIRYSKMRSRLGLPEAVKIIDPPKESYAGTISKIITSVSIETGLKLDASRILIDTNKSPDEILVVLRRHYQDLLKKPVHVWGIGTPLVVPIQYGEAQYQIPTSFVANAILIGLAPLLIAWFGSVYVTRQRELLILREIRDYKISFPHVLNILPIVFSSLSIFSFNRFDKMKRRMVDQKMNRIATSLIRSFVLMLFILPMVVIVGFSVIELILNRPDVALFEILLTFLVGMFLFIQVVQLILQEWIILWNKEYYA